MLGLKEDLMDKSPYRYYYVDDEAGSTGSVNALSSL